MTIRTHASDPSGPPDAAFSHALFHLLRTSKDAALEVLEPHIFVLHADRRSFVVVRYAPELEGRLEALLGELLSSAGTEPLELALLGGGARASQLLTHKKPGRASVRVLHMPSANDGSLAEPMSLLGHGRSRLMAALQKAKEQADKAVDTPPDAQALVTAARANFALQARERRAFAERLNARRPLATYAIMGLVAVVFLLELATGATQSTSALVDMGALHGPSVMAGEWWRLASSTLLHGGLMHVAFNSYVLFLLGGMVERLLGTPRFVILYVISGVVAALGSTLLIGGVSVGASGAIWGLLGAEAALAFGPSTLLPSTVRKSAQRVTLVNLGINTVVSFLPFVDWAAHFAGGAAGAALVFSGLLLPSAKGSKQAASSGIRWAAAMLFSIFLGAGVFGVLTGLLPS